MEGGSKDTGGELFAACNTTQQRVSREVVVVSSRECPMKIYILSTRARERERGSGKDDKSNKGASVAGQVDGMTASLIRRRARAGERERRRARAASGKVSSLFLAWRSKGPKPRETAREKPKSSLKRSRAHPSRWEGWSSHSQASVSVTEVVGSAASEDTLRGRAEHIVVETCILYFIQSREAVRETEKPPTTTLTPPRLFPLPAAHLPRSKQPSPASSARII